jgi:hypothetical protein
MRFPDGVIRPAYNAQIAAAPKEGVIVSIELTDRRNDAGLATPNQTCALKTAFSAVIAALSPPRSRA